MTFIDHYLVLGLQSGNESYNLSTAQITTAYRSKALEIHPDKRPNDPNAVAGFQSLQASYEILKNESTRKAFDFDLMSRMQREEKVVEEEKVEPKRNKNSDHEEKRKRSSRWGPMMFDAEDRYVMRMMDDLNSMQERKLKRMKFDDDVERRTASFAGMMKGLVR